MCSCRTYVPVIAAIVIPAFDLRAALRLHPRLQAKAAALAPLPGTEPLIGSVTGLAEAKSVRPGMRLGEALAMCPELELVDDLIVQLHLDVLSVGERSAGGPVNTPDTGRGWLTALLNQ